MKVPTGRFPVSHGTVAKGAYASNYADPDSYPIDARGLAYSWAFFSAKHLGAGQYYLMTINDQQGQPFEGSGNYRLNVPANAPVTLYWSATAYDRDTHALIRNMRWASRASTTPGVQKNADGSVDIYFGPKAPAGKESNWIPTDPNGKFEVLFRFYGPQKPLFDKNVEAARYREGELRRGRQKRAAHVNVSALLIAPPARKDRRRTRKQIGARHRRQLHPR